jgi:hypothetical protein
MRKIFLIILCYFFTSADVVEWSFLQKDDTNAKIKAVYIYNFTRYFEWPSDKREGNFIISTVGSNTGLTSELQKLAEKKMVGNQKIELKSATTLSDAGQCNIVYLIGDNSTLLKDAVTKYKGKGTLVICEKSGMAKAGAVINFIIDDNKQTFELNTASATKVGLKVSGNLKDLAKSVFN